MPQSLSVFAVSLQEHPELLESIIRLSARNVKGYYHSSNNISVQECSAECGTERAGADFPLFL